MERAVPVVIAASLALALSGCAAIDGPRLHEYQPGSGGGVAVPNTTPGARYSFDDIAMCVEGEGSVTVTEVEAIEPTGGFAVTAFSVLPMRGGEVSNYVVDSVDPLADAGYPMTGEMTVATTCPTLEDDGTYRNYSRLGIEVAGGSASSTSRGIRVVYDSNGIRRTVDYPFGIGLCDSAPIEACQPDPIRIE